MSFSLIVEDTFYKEELIVTDSYTRRGVYYEGTSDITYKSFSGTIEPHDATEGIVLPSGTASKDARTLYSSEILLTYDITGEISTADSVYITDPEVGRYKPQRYTVMEKAAWSTNSGFTLIDTNDANEYLLIREEKVVEDGS